MQWALRVAPSVKTMVTKIVPVPVRLKRRSSRHATQRTRERMVSNHQRPKAGLVSDVCARLGDTTGSPHSVAKQMGHDVTLPKGADFCGVAVKVLRMSSACIGVAASGVVMAKVEAGRRVEMADGVAVVVMERMTIVFALGLWLGLVCVFERDGRDGHCSPSPTCGTSWKKVEDVGGSMTRLCNRCATDMRNEEALRGATASLPEVVAGMSVALQAESEDTGGSRIKLLWRIHLWLMRTYRRHAMSIAAVINERTTKKYRTGCPALFSSAEVVIRFVAGIIIVVVSRSTVQVYFFVGRCAHKSVEITVHIWPSSRFGRGCGHE